MLISISHDRKGYTNVSIKGKKIANYRLGCMVFETALWDFLLSKGVPLRKIQVDHRGSLDDTYIHIEEANGYCANPQKWYEEKILAVEATRKRKRK